MNPFLVRHHPALTADFVIYNAGAFPANKYTNVSGYPAWVASTQDGIAALRSHAALAAITSCHH